MSQKPTDFDIHDANAVLSRLAQLRQALRQLDDEVTGLIYIAAAQMQKEHNEAIAKKRAEEKAAKEAVAENSS